MLSLPPSENQALVFHAACHRAEISCHLGKCRFRKPLLLQSQCSEAFFEELGSLLLESCSLSQAQPSVYLCDVFGAIVGATMVIRVVAAKGLPSHLSAGKPSFHIPYSWLLLIPQIKEFQQTSPADKTSGSWPCHGHRAAGCTTCCCKDHLSCTGKSKGLIIPSFLTPDGKTVRSCLLRQWGRKSDS